MNEIAVIITKAKRQGLCPKVLYLGQRTYINLRKELFKHSNYGIFYINHIEHFMGLKILLVPEDNHLDVGGMV